MQTFYFILNLLPIIAQVIVFIIGVFMLVKFAKKGSLLTAPALSGAAFVLLTFNSIIGLTLLLLNVLGII